MPTQNLDKENLNRSFVQSIPPYTKFTSWNPNARKLQSLSKDMSSKVEHPPQLHQDAKRLGFQLLPDQGSSSTTESNGQSQDQCNSSESGEDEICGKGVEGQIKPIFLQNNLDLMSKPSQVSHSNLVGHIPYPYADPYFSGFLTAYGPQPMMVGIAPPRVPLPLDLAQDGPIYVNPKQYHGILRRRQSRAKLEAQNKLLKARKPYLHESRHRHALNRVRGSGGRFLSKKELQQAYQNSTNLSHHVSDSINLDQGTQHTESHDLGSSEFVTIAATPSDTTSVSNTNAIFWQPDRRFSGIPPHTGAAMQFRGGLMPTGTQHCASVVR